MLKKTLVIAAAALLAPSVSALIVGAWIGTAELKHKLEMKKLDAATK